MDSIQMIHDYHENTKHPFPRFANSLGYLDWDTQPNPFRRFEGAELILLPFQTKDETPLYEDIFHLGGVAPQPLSLESIGKFLEYSLTLSAWKQFGDSKWALRVNPSSGNLHPTEGYLILPTLEKINPLPGVYHYAPKEHGLEKRGEFSKDTWAHLPQDVFLVALSSIYWRESWKYGERGFRYCQHDCGHAFMALSVATRMLGWRLHLLPNIDDEVLATLLGLNRKDAFHGGEEESPDLLAVVHLNSTTQNIQEVSSDFVDGVVSGSWYGAANQLSQSHHDWEAIEEAHQASVKPKTTLAVADFQEGERYPVDYPKAFSSYQVIQKRRSAVAMDGETQLSKEAFYQMLMRVGFPFREIPWTPKIHLGLFVHRIQGLPPGLYGLIRREPLEKIFKAAMHPHFLWEKPSSCPERLGLYLLQEGDFRDVAKMVSCGQDIAGDGAFSLGIQVNNG